MHDEIKAIQLKKNGKYAILNPKTHEYEIRSPTPEEVGQYLVVWSYLDQVFNGMKMFDNGE
jgi:hypothetical protein